MKLIEIWAKSVLPEIMERKQADSYASVYTEIQRQTPVLAESSFCESPRRNPHTFQHRKRNFEIQDKGAIQIICGGLGLRRMIKRRGRIQREISCFPVLFFSSKNIGIGSIGIHPDHQQIDNGQKNRSPNFLFFFHLANIINLVNMG